jgi:hypothetical protein
MVPRGTHRTFYPPQLLRSQPGRLPGGSSHHRPNTGKGQQLGKASLQAKAPARIGIGSLEDRAPGYTDGTELLQHCEHLYATPVPGKLEAVFNVDQFAVEVS